MSSGKRKPVEYNGRMVSMAELAQMAGITRAGMRKRIVICGMTAEQAVALGPGAGAGKRVEYEYNGRMVSMAELARMAGITRDGMRKRIVIRGMTAEQAVALGPGADEPRKGTPMYDVGGEMLTVRQMSERSGVKANTIWHRINRGETPERAMATNSQRLAERMAARKQPGWKAEKAERPVLKWHERAFVQMYSLEESEALGLREHSPDCWGWLTPNFVFRAELIDKRHMLLRAWMRSNGNLAMLRIYAVDIRDGASDEITEIGDPEAIGRMLGEAGIA